MLRAPEGKRICERCGGMGLAIQSFSNDPMDRMPCNLCAGEGLRDIAIVVDDREPQLNKPRILDLCCGVGGAGMGYAQAGFEVVGVDIKRQRHYPFEFHKADALTFPLEGFDAVHVSPPCQAYSDMAHLTKRDYPKLIEPIRARLAASGLPYVIENVEGAPLVNPIVLCGVERGLRFKQYVLRRHRLFESNVPLWSNGCRCFNGDGVTMAVYGGGNTNKPRTSKTSGGRPYKGTANERRAIMGISWATMAEVNEAIPPAYTEWIGKQLLTAIERAA